MQLLPLQAGGEFAGMLDSCLDAARDLHARLYVSEAYQPVLAPELDIVVYAATAATASESGKLARRIFDIAAEKELHLAVIELPSGMLKDALPDMTMDADSVSCLRSVLMKPEHADWVEPIVDLLEAAAKDAG